MKKTILNLAVCVTMGWCGVQFLAWADSTTQPWIFIAMGIFAILVAIRYLLVAIAGK